MKIRFLPVGGLVLALVLNGVVASRAGADDAPPSDPPPPQPVRIMLTGDSITQGFDGDFTWRYRLWQEFQRQGVAVDFVGPSKYPYGGHRNYLAAGWDSDHSAVGGTRLSDQLRPVSATDPTKRVTRDVTAYPADVLVAGYGTTDMIHGGTVASVVSDWRAYLEAVRLALPDVKILLPQVTSKRVARREQLNAAVRGLVAELNAAHPTAPRMHVVDLENAPWNAERFTFDGTHPNPTGESVIAQRVAFALRGIGVLKPGVEPGIRQGTIAWTAAFPATVTVSRAGRLAVNWRTSKAANRAQFMRLRVADASSGRVRPLRWTREARAVTRLRPGTYVISVRGMRGTMASVWTTVKTVRVPRR